MRTSKRIGSRGPRIKTKTKKRFTKELFRRRYTIERNQRIFTNSILLSLRKKWDRPKVGKFRILMGALAILQVPRSLLEK